MNVETIVPPKAPTPFDGGNWGTLVTEDQMRRTSMAPEATRSHQPIEHAAAFDYFSGTMSRMGFVLSEPTLYLTNDENRSNMYAGFGIAHVDMPQDRDFQFQAFMINSHDKSYSLQVGAGHETFICTNGMVLAPLGISRAKHTRHVHRVDASGLPRWQNRVLQSCQNIQNECLRFLKLTGSLKTVGLDPSSTVHRKHVDHVLMEARRRGIINNAGVASVEKHWMTPEHEEFKSDETVWRLMQAFTSHNRGKSAFRSTNTTSDMFNLFSDKFGTLRADGTVPVRQLDTPTLPAMSDGGDF